MPRPLLADAIFFSSLFACRPPLTANKSLASRLHARFNRIRYSLPRNLALSHIARQPDRTSIGVWGPYQLKSAFQPIFEFQHGKLHLAAFEGLIRPYREAQSVSVGEFFSKFTALERFHIETLTRTLHFFNAAEFIDAKASIFVNFDPRVFSDRQVADGAIRDMRLILHETGIDAKRVVCEIIENKSASDEVLHAFAGTLRDHGFRIAVDDYGADGSDLNRVRHLKPDIVKFDSIWISRLLSSGPGEALLKVMVSSFRDQGILTIFEGLEEGWQLEVAERCEVSMVQGYVLGRPQIVPFDFSALSGQPTSVAVQDAPAEHLPSAPEIERKPFVHATREARPFGRRPQTP